MTAEPTLESLILEQTAQARFSGAYPDAQLRATRYERFHRYFAPPGGDQWPEDLSERPGKLHITANIIRPFVDTEARLMSLLPRLTIPAIDADPDTRKRAEAVEKLFDRFLKESNFEQWFFTFNQVKGLYGLGILKPYWNKDNDMPDVSVVEQPQNIVFGWGDSDFQSLDWAIYHYKLSRLQIGLKFPDFPRAWMGEQKDEKTRMSDTGRGNHYDPLNQNMASLQGRQQTEYERDQVVVWDYWYVDADGVVQNATLVNGHVADGPFAHNEMPAIPYIPVEHDHEPGSPDGRGTAELLLDVQMGLNRAMTHYAQYVWDTTDPAYQLTGEDAPMTVPPGLVPRSGQIVAPGARTRIEEIKTGVNNFPFDALIQQYWQMAFKLTGLSEILFGSSPGAQTSARSLSIQLESSINRLDPKRKRAYSGLITLLKFWHFMASNKPLKIDGIKVKDAIKGIDRWKVVAPELTPRDVIEHTQNVANKVNAKLLSLETGMDEVGVENPLEEIDRIMAERSNAHLFPADAQSIAAVTATLQAIGQQQAAQQAAAEGQGVAAGVSADAQEAQPALFEDQAGAPTAAGTPPPPGSPAPMGGELQPMVRQAGNGPSNPMSQIILPRRKF